MDIRHIRILNTKFYKILKMRLSFTSKYVCLIYDENLLYKRLYL